MSKEVYERMTLTKLDALLRGKTDTQLFIDVPVYGDGYVLQPEALNALRFKRGTEKLLDADDHIHAAAGTVNGAGFLTKGYRLFLAYVASTEAGAPDTLKTYVEFSMDNVTWAAPDGTSGVHGGYNFAGGKTPAHTPLWFLFPASFPSADAAGNVNEPIGGWMPYARITSITTGAGTDLTLTFTIYGVP